MFASRSRVTIPLPFHPPHTVTVQKLTGRDLEVAASEHLRGEILGRNPRGWAEKFRKLLAEGNATDADALKALADPLGGYDRLTVAQRGIKAWTCVEPDGKTPIPVTDATIADLDDDALEFCALEVMRLTKPALFETAETAGTDEKNGCGLSTSH